MKATENFQHLTLVLVSLLLFSSCASQQKAIQEYTVFSTKGKNYAHRYGYLAVKEMIRSGVPASITLAQAMIESAYGSSLLSKRGNNHFGIKCHGWRGRKMYLDDDGNGDCFRVYGSVEQSFRDHSNFLRGNSRYRFLFFFKPTDYRAWAQGLGKAGYATNPNYPELLINLIEKNGLYFYDTARIGRR